MPSVIIEPSSHISFRNHLFLEEGQGGIPLIHPEGDYRELNRYLDRLNKILDQHSPETHYTIYVDWSRGNNAYCMNIENHSLLFEHADNNHDFMSHAQTHQDGLIKSLKRLIELNEKTYHAHPLIENKRVNFHKVVSHKSEDIPYPFKIFIPLGDFPVTVDAMKQCFDKLDLFRPDATLNMNIHHENYRKNYFIRPILRVKKNSHFIVGKDVRIAKEDIDDFYLNNTVMDNYLSQAYYSLIKAVEYHDDYKHIQAKVELFHRLNEHFNEQDSQKNNDNDSSIVNTPKI